MKERDGKEKEPRGHSDKQFARSTLQPCFPYALRAVSHSVWCEEEEKEQNQVLRQKPAAPGNTGGNGTQSVERKKGKGTERTGGGGLVSPLPFLRGWPPLPVTTEEEEGREEKSWKERGKCKKGAEKGGERCE